MVYRLLLCATRIAIPLSIAAPHTVVAETDEMPELPNIVVTAKPVSTAQPFLDTTSVSIRGREDIERFESRDLFSVLQDVPGVAVIGGALENGKSFSIRGFSDSEDVSVELDGIPRDFEKYRFGTGVFIDPELLRQVEVWRQPSVRSTPGAVGGAVRAWSRNPQELIPTGKSWYTSAKASLSTNNNGRRVSGIAAGQATEMLGGLLALSRRRSGDITVSGGEKLENSDTDNTSALAKLHIQPADALSVALSFQGWRDKGLEPFDATAGIAGVFGTVRRTTDDETYAVNLSYVPTDWLTVNLNAGHTITQVEDFSDVGQSFVSPPGIGPTRDNYEFRSTAFRLENRVQQTVGEHAIDWYIGADGLKSERESKRVTSNAAFNESVYPNGDNLSQPSGEKAFAGAYTLLRWSWRPVLLFGGLRRTEYRAAAVGTAAENLEMAGQASSLRFGSTTGEYGAELRAPWGVTLFYNNATAIRPPLLDEYFTQGGFSRCIPLFLGPALAPASRACGDLYVPEEVRSREIGISIETPFDTGRGNLAIKILDFSSKVRNPLETIGPYDGVVAQPGIGRRDGLEIEAEIAWAPLFTRIGYTRIRADSSKPPVDQITPDIPDDNDIQDRLYFVNVPADRLSVLAGTRFLDDTLEIGYRFSRTASRQVGQGDIFGFDTVRQGGYSLHDLYLLWMPSEQISLRVVGSNLGDESYSLSNGLGGGIGTAAPGRDFTFVASVYF